jgi:hypothetical protein
MKTWKGIGLAALAAAAWAGAGSPVSGQDAAGDRIPRLVKDLGADDLRTRDAATRELESIGEPAVPALREAARSDDPEVAWRARSILDRVEGERDTKARPGGEGPDGGGGPRLHSYNFRFSPGASNSSVIITQDGTGRLSVSVTEETDGKRETRTYEAESAEAFRQKHPEVAKRYGIGEAAGAAPRAFRDFVPPGRFWEDWGLDEDLFGGDWPRGLGEDLDRLHEDVRRRLDGVLRDHRMDRWRERFMQRFQDRFGPGDPGGEGNDDGERAEEPPPQGPDAGGADRPAPATLGVAVEEPDPALRDQLRLGDQEGVVIGEVAPGSRAERAGLKVHDVIVHVNGTPVKGAWEMRRVLRAAAAADPDGELELGVIRGGAKQTVKVRMR